MSALPRVTLKPPTGFVHDQRSEGWELLEEGPQVEGEPILDFLSFLREGETYVNGETVLARALKMDGTEAGQHHLERLLAQAKEIPAELQPFYLVATGTKWRYPDGFVCVPFLLWRDGQWVLRFSSSSTTSASTAGTAAVGWFASASSLGPRVFGASDLLAPWSLGSGSVPLHLQRPCSGGTSREVLLDRGVVFSGGFGKLCFR